MALDGTLYIGTFKGSFVAVNSRGYKKWEVETGHEIRSSAAIAGDGAILFGGRDRNLHALTAGGREKWRFRTGGWVDASPAIAAQYVFGSEV